MNDHEDIPPVVLTSDPESLDPRYEWVDVTTFEDRANDRLARRYAPAHLANN